jgi:hypothetical protein
MFQVQLVPRTRVTSALGEMTEIGLISESCGWDALVFSICVLHARFSYFLIVLVSEWWLDFNKLSV